ncbi:MAG TPA: hypothetical protein VM238_01105 [Phycisphaerae bacterium]|nr:hypothetical protein [Phycisphaerae bacterium]
MARLGPMRLVSAAVAAGLAVAAPATAAEFQVPLTVTESAGVARTAEPISGGVPLPRGAFRKDQGFCLTGADGKEVACQVTPLVVEADDTLRWVLLDFQDDVAAGGTNTYTLRAAKPTLAPKQTLSIQAGPDGITVDTGRIRFTISKTKPFALFDSVTAGGKPVVTGGQISYTQMQGRAGWDDKADWQPRTFRAAAPDTAKVWYAGPTRVTLEVAGRFADDPFKAGYRAFLTAWAGSSRVYVKYSLTNSNADRRTAILVERSAIRLDLAGVGIETLLGAAQPLAVGVVGSLHQGLRLSPSDAKVAAVRADGTGTRLWTGREAKDRPAGWIAAGTPPVYVCDVLFSTNPARRLAVDGKHLLLEPIAERFDGTPDPQGRRPSQPWQADGFWLYDCSHHTSEYLFDFAWPADTAPAGDGAALDALAKAARNRLWVLAPGEHYSACDVLGTGRFGTLADEKACYDQWAWTWNAKQVPAAPAPPPGAFVPWEDNHYESEADSVQALLLMYLRTGQRGWFDLAEAWARYHADLQAWRTDGWQWKDGAIWFPQGGPQGNRRVREDWNFAWGPDWGNRKGNPDCYDLWRHSQAKACYCHFYGSGLADYFCLTGDRDALVAAIDDVEQKAEEFRRHGRFEPGKTPVGSIRGFGRGFEVAMRVLMADPTNPLVAETCHLAARTLRESPLLDERGFHASRIGGGFGGMAAKNLSANTRKWMNDRGITFTQQGDTVDTLTKGDKTWPVRSFGGTWQHLYIQNGADLYARHFDDDDMRDFTIAFAKMAERYMLSPKCRQTWYYTYFDVPDFGMVFDPWVFDHTTTTDGEGCVHSGWYTRFFPDACAKGFSWTGEKAFLEKGKAFWYYGSKREYQTKGLRGGPNEVNRFAGHTPPKDDQVLSTSRLFYEWSHPRTDTQPPQAVRDLAVKRLGGGKAEIRFTAPADAGGGKVARYQVKAATLPIVPYEAWDCARDAGANRNWWMAANLKGEPAPSKPGTAERFTVTGVPDGQPLYFAVRSFDDSWNRSAVSNVATP